MSNLVSKYPALKKTTKMYKRMTRLGRQKCIKNGQFARDIIPYLENDEWCYVLAERDTSGSLEYYEQLHLGDYDADGMCFNELIEMWKESMNDIYQECFKWGHLDFRNLPRSVYVKKNKDTVKEFFKMQAEGKLEEIHLMWLYYGYTTHSILGPVKGYDPIIYKCAKEAIEQYTNN